MTYKIDVSNLTKIFGSDPQSALERLERGEGKDSILADTLQTVAVQDVGFQVEEGEIFVVMGLSGSGKSTLIRMLNRLIPATSGRIAIDGEDLLQADERTLRAVRLQKIAMVFQHFALFPHKSVRENVEYGLKIQGTDRRTRRERATKALDSVGLGPYAESRTSQLSGGMQQRVGLARGLAVDPEILLMDEPFSALDPLIRREMQSELVTLQRQLKKTIVFITHDLLEALILGDRIAIMKEGRFVQVGTPEEIVAHPADDYVAEFVRDVDRSRVFSVDRVMEAPEALDLATDTVGSALARMRETGRSALHVLDAGRLAGVVTWRDLDGGESDSLGGRLTGDVPTTAPDRHLYRLFGACSAGLPVAVLDGGRLVGTVRPEAVFEALASDDDQSRAA